MTAHPFTAVLLIPTGIGAAIGGYAGDAIPVVRTMATVCDRIITHPNVLNGAQLYWPLSNAWYVEGYALDQFAAGHWGLRPVHRNRIGLVLDRAIEAELRLRHLQAVDAARATLGLIVDDVLITDMPLGVTLKTAASGAAWGTIDHPDSLLRAVDQLLTHGKVDAIAVVARFPDDSNSDMLQAYRQGHGVDLLAGAEAVISHLVVQRFHIPCAHAPALAPLPLAPALNPKAAAEELGYTFLPSVLAGLSRAPQVMTDPHHPTDLWRDQVDAVVVPATACGGSAVLSFSRSQAQIITVQENTTRMSTTADTLGIQHRIAQSYLEAVGILAAMKAGIDERVLRPSISITQVQEPVE
ncbi:DUF3326 domain-containing protein [Acaryochloris sp. IP29b_bin.137]|uniref:DUF3326 domain-containing protein n=1 Tax=Acaryochloris sp. IP29b_bin.137 TaxID=2969217 RepID=UPI0026042838|nr:DUF3326 domain-containing protein [Acaryochloris sp. IP29b_bin.137]